MYLLSGLTECTMPTSILDNAHHPHTHPQRKGRHSHTGMQPGQSEYKFQRSGRDLAGMDVRLKQSPTSEADTIADIYDATTSGGNKLQFYIQLSDLVSIKFTIN